MVSEAEAKEIAGNHVDQVVGGPNVRYRVRDSWVRATDVEVEVDVWRGADQRDDADRYVVDVDMDGNITDSGWE